MARGALTSSLEENTQPYRVCILCGLGPWLRRYVVQSRECHAILLPSCKKRQTCCTDPDLTSAQTTHKTRPEDGQNCELDDAKRTELKPNAPPERL